MTAASSAGPKYTPYANASSFVIGLSALDPKHWIEPDEDLDVFLTEKDRLRGTEVDTIFRQVEGSEAGQRACLDLLVEHLVNDHPDLSATAP